MGSTLADQVGAMGVVDRLRFENHRVQDYMNTAAQKARLIEKIAAGYAAEGTTVPYEIIQQGVDQWYQSRLVFKATDVPWYFRLYIRRDRWMKPVIIGCTAVFLIAGTWFAVSQIRHQQSLNRVSASILASEAAVSQLRRESPAGGFDRATVEPAYAFVAQIYIELRRNEQSIATLETRIQQELDAKRRDLDLATVADLSVLNELVRQYQALFTKKYSLLENVQAFEGLVTEFAQIQQSAEQRSSPALEAWVAKTDALLRNPRVSLEEARTALVSLREKLSFSAEAYVIHAEVNNLVERALRQLSIDNEKNQVRSLASKILADIEALTAPQPEDLKRLEFIEMLSRTPVRLVINSDNTQKSGAEREFSESGGKAWYVIVQAIGEGGIPIKLQVKSVETGQEAYVNLFGIRVSQDRYETVRKDKMDDGIVNQNLIGAKPAGILTFDLKSGVFPEYILEW